MGADAQEEIAEINARLKKIEAGAMKSFPLSSEEYAELRAEWREHVLGIAEVERTAIEMLQENMR